jgi:hypothetical protein
MVTSLSVHEFLIRVNYNVDLSTTPCRVDSTNGPLDLDVSRLDSWEVLAVNSRNLCCPLQVGNLLSNVFPCLLPLFLMAPYSSSILRV